MTTPTNTTTSPATQPVVNGSGPTPVRPVPALPAPITSKGKDTPKPATGSPGTPAKPKDKPKALGKMETIEVNADVLMAALLCVATDETRYYLQGVYLHRTADGFVRCVATDGHRCLIGTLYRETKDKPGPKWLDAGVIIPADGLAQRLKLIDKEHGDLGLGVRISYGENQPRVEITDGMGVNVFRVTPVDGKFPDYQRVTTANWSGVGVERGDWKPTGFNPGYLKAVGDIAKRLGSGSVECFDYAKEDGSEQPVLFTFGKVDNVVLFLMPQRVEQQKVAEATRLLLAPSIKLTIAALRAHETRNVEAAKKLTGAEKEAAIAKAEEFAKRIKAVLDNAGTGQVQAALPAPKPAKVKAAPTAIAKAAQVGGDRLKAVLDKAAPKAKPRVKVSGINGARKPAPTKQQVKRK